MTPRWIVALTLLPLLALAAVVSACGDDDDDPPSGNATRPAAAATTAATRAATTAAGTPASTPAASTTAAAGSGGVKVTGGALTDDAGFTLYTFDADEPGKSNCADPCTQAWPPHTTTESDPPSGVEGATGTFTLVPRDDGTEQIAYNGKPLYRFVNDKAPGEKNGDGVGGVWHTATP